MLANRVRPVFFLRLGRRTLGFLAAVLLCLSATLPAAAQEASDLRARLERGYEVLPLEEGLGLVLIPREERAGIRSIRIEGQSVLINGAQVPEPALQAWLGSDAEPILELLHQSPQQRKRLLAAPAAEAAPPVTVEQPPTAADEPIPKEDSSQEDTGETPTERRRIRSDARVSVGSPLTVEADEVAEDVVVIGAPLTVEGEVEGDAMVIGGNVDVSGHVGGDLGAIGGHVSLADTANVEGDVIAVGGKVEREPGARIGGDISGVSLGRHGLNVGDWLRFDLHPWRPGLTPWFFSPTRNVLNGAGGIIFLCVVASVLLLIARGTVERAGQVIAAEPWKAGFVGFLSMVLLSFVGLILLISIIGWPVLALMILVAIAVFFLGFTAVACRLGTWAERHFNLRLGSIYLAAALGILLIQICSLAADALGFASWPLLLLVLMLGMFGFLIQFAAWMVGFGGVVLSRFRPVPVLSGAAAPPPPPPAPGPMQQLPEPAPHEEPAKDEGDEEGEENDLDRQLRATLDETGKPPEEPPATS